MCENMQSYFYFFIYIKWQVPLCSQPLSCYSFFYYHVTFYFPHQKKINLSLFNYLKGFTSLRLAVDDREADPVSE